MSDIDPVHRIVPTPPVAAPPERMDDRHRHKKHSDEDRIELHSEEELPLPDPQEPEDLVEAPNRIDIRA